MLADEVPPVVHMIFGLTSVAVLMVTPVTVYCVPLTVKTALDVPAPVAVILISSLAIVLAARATVELAQVAAAPVE